MKRLILIMLMMPALGNVAKAQLTTPWAIGSTGQWPSSGAGIQYNSTGDMTFGLSSVSGQVSLYVDGGFRQAETGKVNYFMDKIGQGLTTPLVNFHLQDGAPISPFGLISESRIAVDVANGGVMQFRTSMNNGSSTGLVFSDDNLGGYLVYRNDSDDRLHLGGYSGISFEVGSQNTLTKTEAMRIGSTGRSYFATYPTGAGGANAYSMEVGGTNPTSTSGQATVFLHHHGVIAHQLRYTNGSLYLEAAGNGYGTSSTPNFFVGGKIGVGTTSPDEKLTVKGKIHAEEIRVDLSVPGPDYVFESTYALPSIDDVKSYIKANKHLPEIPSAKEMETNGVQVGEMNLLLLKKIEELTLYVIDLKEQNDKQNKEIDALKKQISK